MNAALLLAAALAPQAAPEPASWPRPIAVDVEGVILGYYIRLFTYPAGCAGSRGKGCLKPPKRIKVVSFTCGGTGTDTGGRPTLLCRVTYRHIGGSLAHVQGNDECTPMRYNPQADAEPEAGLPTWTYAWTEDVKTACDAS